MLQIHPASYIFMQLFSVLFPDKVLSSLNSKNNLNIKLSIKMIR